MKKILSIILAILMVVSMLPASALSVFAAEGTEMSVTGTATIDLSQYSEGDTINISEDYKIIGDGNEYNISLNIAEDATVIFDVGASGVKLGGQITVADGKTLTLLVAGDAEHTVNGGISLGNASNVVIEGDLDKPNNKLTVTATGSDAGIGANNGVTAGDITIRNARVEATGSGSADSPKVAGAGIGTAKASMGNILIVNSIVTAAGGYYSEYEAHGAAIGMGSDGVSMGNITLIDSEITASHSGEGHASIIGAGPDFAEGDRDGSDIGTMGDIIITNTDLHLSMAESTTDEYAAMIGTADFSGGYFSYSVNMGKIIFTDITQAELDEMIATWYIPSDFDEYGGYVLGLGYWSHVYKYNEYEAHCVGAFGGVWVSDGNGGIVQIGNDDGYYVDCEDGGYDHDFDEICGGTCSDCGVTYFVAHTVGTPATCTALAVCSVCGESYGELAEHTAEPTYTDNGDGTHKATYSCCGATVTAAHNYKSGTPAGTCVCGEVCPHSSFDAATGNCTDCETSLAIAKIETGETTTYYLTAYELSTAIENNSADQAITLLANFEVIRDLCFYAGEAKNTLDLNGHTLTGSSRIDVEYGELTITGTGSINIFMTADDEGTKIVVGSGVTLNNSLRSVYGGVLDLTNATIPEAGLNVILYTDDWEPATYNVSDVLLLPADYYFFVDGKAVSSYSEETVGTVLKHAEHSYTYTDNGDGTHDKVCLVCDYVEVDNEAHTGGTATCTAKAVCDVCGKSYGELDKNNHDETVAYVNGFCPNCDAFEPAKLVNGVYEISNAGNLYWFADKVTNENATYGSADAILTCDIRVNEGTMTEAGTDARVWTPIGKHGFGVNIPYTGTFEGNGKTVSGLYFNDNSANFSVSLFSLVGEGGKVQNVGIADSYLCGSQSIGAVAGSNYGTVTGCYNTGTVSGNSVGGVVGYNYGTVTNCYNTGIISGSDDSVGGVVGSNRGTVTGCYNTGTVSGSDTVGGVVGYNSGTATGCYNTGTVSGSSYVGGVVGDNSHSTVEGCYNTGTVNGESSVGGVAGSGSTTQGCYNTGTVNGESSVGGVVGSMVGEASLVGCYNSGTVSGSSNVGGVVGLTNATVTNCYFDSTVYTGDAIGNNYGTATDVEGKSTEQFAGGEVAYLLSRGENGFIWGQDLDNGKPVQTTPTFNGAKVYCGYTSCGDTVAKYTNDETISAEKPDHTQKPTYTDNGNGTHSAVYPCCGTTVTEEHDFENDAHQCVCGYACPHDSYTDGVCDNCGYECPHSWGEGVLTRPTFETDGYYTYTCTLCGEEKTETAKEADTTALNDASMKVMEYIDNDTLTQEAANEIHNSYLDILKNNGNNIFDEFGFVRNDLVEEDQPAINAATAELEKIIADAEEKIASGEYVKADYTEINKAIKEIEDKFFYEDVTDEGKAGLEEIKKQLEEMKADENTSEADLAELEKELEAYEEELDKGIEDGTLVMVRPEKIGTELSDRWTERLEAEGLLDEREDFVNNQKYTDEAVAVSEEMEKFLASLEGTVAENAENIAKLNEMFNSFTASFENCLRGTHNFNDYEVTSPAKCGENAVETRTCWFCGETDEREVEGSALSHSFTKYEVTEEAKCGVAGKKTAYCDHGCGATDEKEIEALTHVFDKFVSNGDATCTADGTKTASCIHGCGTEETVTDEGTKLDHADEDGDKICDDCEAEIIDVCPDCGRPVHEDEGIPHYICIIIMFIRLVVSLVKALQGIA